MRTSRHRQPLEVASDLNITNLLDTAFILLITFMLVAPQLEHGITVNLPEVKDAPAISPDPSRTLSVTIMPRGEGRDEEWIYLDGKQVTLEELHSKVRRAREDREDVAVLVQPDRDARSEALVQVLGAITRAGVKNIGIGTKPKGLKKP